MQGTFWLIALIHARAWLAELPMAEGWWWWAAGVALAYAAAGLAVRVRVRVGARASTRRAGQPKQRARLQAKFP
jgi:hypothetical protein